MTALRVLHVIEAMHTGGAESLIVEHVRHAGPGVESLVCALNRGGPTLDAAIGAGARGLVLEHRIQIEGWVTLVLRAPSRSKRRARVGVGAVAGRRHGQ